MTTRPRMPPITSQRIAKKRANITEGGLAKERNPMATRGRRGIRSGDEIAPASRKRSLRNSAGLISPYFINSFMVND